MTKQWSQHSRKEQRAMIMNHQPWKNSTGPKSDEGKHRSSKNAYKGKSSIRDMQKMVRKVHRERLELIRWLEQTFSIYIKI